MRELVNIGGVLFFTHTWYHESLVTTIPEFARKVKIEGFDLEKLAGLVPNELEFMTNDDNTWFLFHWIEIECIDYSCFMCLEDCDNNMNAHDRNG